MHFFGIFWKLINYFGSLAHESNEEEDDVGEEETMEHLEVLVVDAVEPFRAEYEVMYAHSTFPQSSSGTKSTTGWAGLADLKTFDASWWDVRGRGAGEVVVCGRVLVGGSSGWIGEDGEGEKGDGSERVIVVERVELERMVGASQFFFPCIMVDIL
jgi:hypothetical protein